MLNLNKYRGVFHEGIHLTTTVAASTVIAANVIKPAVSKEKSTNAIGQTSELAVAKCANRFNDSILSQLTKKPPIP